MLFLEITAKHLPGAEEQPADEASGDRGRTHEPAESAHRPR